LSPPPAHQHCRLVLLPLPSTSRLSSGGARPFPPTADGEHRPCPATPKF
jgi:hypothetical protein